VFELRTSAAALRIIYYKFITFAVYTAGEREDPYFLPEYTMYLSTTIHFFPHLKEFLIE